MPEKPMKIPGPDHPISITPNPGRVVVRQGGKIIADSRRALTLREASYPAGPAGGAGLENAIWSYEAPYDAVAVIKDHLAFYPDRFEITEA